MSTVPSTATLSPRTRLFKELCSGLDAQKRFTIARASSLWLEHLQNRKRRPIRASSAAVFRSYLRHIVSAIGEIEVVDFDNRAMREFVEVLAAKELSPKSIFEITSAVKSIIASIVDPETGEQIYTRKWNASFIDSPEIQNQRQPTVEAKELEAAIQKSDDSFGVLLAVLASSGLRIGEAIALHIEASAEHSHWNRSDSSLVIRTSVWRGREQNDVKTVAGRRVVEIAAPINDLLERFVGSRTDGYLFGNGKPPHYSALHGKLEEVLPKKGFHSARRFRTTCPEDIIRFWLGHADGSITDRYSKLAADADLRRAEVERCGLGFTLPIKKQMLSVLHIHCSL
jgi:integrase